MTETKKHAKYAPSAAHRWMVCHGSVALSQGIKEKSSSYAQEGTECHEAASEYLMENKSWNEATKDLSDDQISIVQEYTDYVLDTMERLTEKGLKPKLWIEQHVKNADNEEHAGTADCGILAGNTLAIIDLKAGWVPVQVKYNKQLMSYALQFLDTHKLWDRVETVRIMIVQPRVYDKPQMVMYGVDQLRDFAKEVGHHIEAIEKGDKTLVAGDHCGFCPAKGKCPELRKAAVEKAKMVFDCPKEAREYSPQEIAEILNEAELIKAHLAGVEQYARRELEKGREIPGYKLVEKRASYKWVDFEPVKRAFEGYEWNVIHTVKPKTPLQIAKVAKELGVKLPDFERRYKKESSGTTLAPDSDNRPAVKPDNFRDEG
jgi:hypothetical protein